MLKVFLINWNQNDENLKIYLILAERFTTIYQHTLINPDVSKIWLGSKLFLFVSNPEMVKNIVMSPKCLEKSTLFYDLMDRGDSLISSKCMFSLK